MESSLFLQEGIMDEHLELIIKTACAIDRQPHEVCAVEKYTQLTPAELNRIVDKRVTELAEHFRFDPASHLDWVHSGITTTDADGETRCWMLFF
jgi:hypothetical protein